MDIFKTDVLKKEFERFQKEDHIEILQCSYCQKTAYGFWYESFLSSCKYCRETFCKKCQKFNLAKDLLLKNSDSTVKNYIENFIQDFANISCKTLETHFKVIKRVPIEKSHFSKSYHKSEKK